MRLIDAPCPTQIRRIDMGVLPIVEAMQRNGVLMDRPFFTQLQTELEEKQRGIVEAIKLMLPDPWEGFNPGSPDQVGELFFDRMELEVPGRHKRTKGGAKSTDDETLACIKHLHPLVGLVVDYRGVQKLLGTYVRTLPLEVDPEDGRLRTIFKTTRARTGRLASGDKRIGKRNMQNIPEEVRGGFIASPGCKLVSLDLSQIELRFAAHLSEDANMIAVYIAGEDLHSRTAIRMFRLVPEEILPLLAADAAGTLTPEQAKALKFFKHRYRLPAKTINFAVLYGVSGQGLQLQILAADGPLFSIAECDGYLVDWFGVYPGVKRWLEKQYERVRAWGMCWTCFGRVRLIPEVKCISQDKVSEGLRQAGNHPVQGSAADLLKIALYELWQVCQYFTSLGKVCRPLLQIHDEAIVECEEDIAVEFAQWGQWIMRTVVKLLVPVDSSADIADRWSLLK